MSRPEPADLREQIDRALAGYLSIETLEPSLGDAMRYATLGGGKKLRPRLVCCACLDLSGDLAAALPAACAVELVHAYSLAHDDLPAMDNADTRHGKASTHITHGHPEAILAGDALQALAFQILADATAVDASTRLRMLSSLAHAIGPLGMVGGQSADMAAEAIVISQMKLEALHRQKTGALLTASFELGGMAAGASDEDLALLIEAGRHTGLAFQVIDDVLDVTGDAESMGKPVGADAANAKNTYPALMGLPAAQRYADDLMHQALAALERLGLRNGLLAGLVVQSVQRSA